MSMEDEARARLRAQTDAAARARRTFEDTHAELDAFVDECVTEFVSAAKNLGLARSDLDSIQRAHPSVKRRRGARWLVPVYVHADENDDHARSNVLLIRRSGAWSWAHEWSALPDRLSDLHRSRIRAQLVAELSRNG